MKYRDLVLIVLTALLASACASRPAKTDSTERAPSAQSVPPPKAAPAKESAKKGPAKKEASEGEIVGKPATGSKFSKLQLGMTLNQVEKAIGRPTRQWTHPTGKASIPFYFGPDRWVIQYSYKGEGVLTINSGGDQLLTRIEVNKAE